MLFRSSLMVNTRIYVDGIKSIIDNYINEHDGVFRGIPDWYILQHYDEYKGKYVPFITYIEFTE